MLGYGLRPNPAYKFNKFPLCLHRHPRKTAFADLEHVRVAGLYFQFGIFDAFAVDADCALFDLADGVGGAVYETGVFEQVGDGEAAALRGEGDLGHVFGQRAFLEAGDEGFLGFAGGVLAVEAGDNFAA